MGGSERVTPVISSDLPVSLGLRCGRDEDYLLQHVRRLGDALIRESLLAGWGCHTARRPVQHLPRARWRSRRPKELPKSARAICCEQVSANCLRERRQQRACAVVLPEWKQISSFTPALSGERAAEPRNIIGRAQNKTRALGWSRRQNQCTFVKRRQRHNAAPGCWWQNTFDSHNRAQVDTGRSVSSGLRECTGRGIFDETRRRKSISQWKFLASRGDCWLPGASVQMHPTERSPPPLWEKRGRLYF
ncbi:unnamed protein product [Pleuronectes platessa]|uniref:Uncharacterized protein n=1 Tax=Pleuronectes platessa TaxID=8262 RepID=A0A9N7TK31_PLEPL|nr:unnamed protein product [Pleuronectes platessa]